MIVPHDELWSSISQQQHIVVCFRFITNAFTYTSTSGICKYIFYKPLANPQDHYFVSVRHNNHDEATKFLSKNTKLFLGTWLEQGGWVGSRDAACGVHVYFFAECVCCVFLTECMRYSQEVSMCMDSWLGFPLDSLWQDYFQRPWVMLPLRKMIPW